MKHVEIMGEDIERGDLARCAVARDEGMSKGRESPNSCVQIDLTYVGVNM
jgi:hypothetical protein